MYVLCVYILYIVLLTQLILAALEVNLFKLPSANTPACTHTHKQTHTRLIVGGLSTCRWICKYTVYSPDFLWQICVVVLVILSKLTVDFSDKWLKLVCIWKRQMQDHLLQFLPKGVDYKNSCLPPFVCSFMSFLFNFCSKNVEK